MKTMVLDLWRCNYGYDEVVFYPEDEPELFHILKEKEWVELGRPGTILVGKVGKNKIVKVAP